MGIKTENKTGADLSGTSGGTSRVLTLTNTALTIQEGFMVYVSGLAIALTSEYTVSHLSASTTITFINPIWDDMTVIVNYYEGVTSNVSGTDGDFLNGPLTDFGVTAVRTPVTMTTNFSGNKTYTDGTNENISIVLQPYNVKYDIDKSGLNKNYDMMAFVGPSVTLNKYDKITYDSKVYRVDNVSTRDFNGTTIMKKAMLYFNDE